MVYISGTPFISKDNKSIPQKKKKGCEPKPCHWLHLGLYQGLFIPGHQRSSNYLL